MESNKLSNLPSIPSQKLSDLSERARKKVILEQLLRLVNVAQIAIDPNGEIIFASSVNELLGYELDELVGESVQRIIPKSHKASHPEHINKAMVDTHMGAFDKPRPLRAVHKDGHEVPVLITMTAIRNRVDEIIGFLAILLNNELQEKLNYQATHNTLTGLPNSVCMHEKLVEHLEDDTERENFSILLYIDIDHFSIVNESLGHESGDKCLIEFANFIQQNTRTTSENGRTLDILGHPQTDEFVLLLKNIRVIEDIYPLMVRLIEKFREFNFTEDTTSFNLTVSMGGFILEPEEEYHSADVLAVAGMTTRKAKEAGRNRFLLESMDTHNRKEQKLQIDWLGKIDNALEQDKFELYFQPISNIKEETEDSLINGEVLIRMIDDDGSVIPPIFLEAAEKYGKMPKIDRWVITNSLEWLAENQERVEKLSINISGVSLSEGESFLNFVYNLVENSNIPGEKICFEITETAIVTQHEFLELFMKKLKTLGCKFAIDDFGAGSAGLGQLLLPFDYIKIDGEFVKGLSSQETSEEMRNRAVIKSAKAFSEELGIKTIAEFIWNEETLEKVKKLKIDEGQGFFIDKPKPLSSI